MKTEPLRLIYKLVIILLIFIILYCILLIKPLWQPVLKIIFIGLLPFIISGFIAFLLHPLVKKLEAMKMKRVYAILIIYILFFGTIGYILYLGIPIFIRQIHEFAEHFPQIIQPYQEWIHNIQSSTSRLPDGLQDQINSRIDDFEKWLNRFLEKSAEVLMGIVNYFVVIAVIPFISFYLLKDVNEVKQAAWYITPRKWRTRGKEFMKAVIDSLGGYIRGQLFVGFLIGVTASISFAVIGLSYPVPLGIIIAVTNIIPYFGPFIGAIPVLLIALMGSVTKAIFAAVVIILLQFLEGNILSPYIVGKSINIHPLFIIAALIFGSEAGGIVGMIIAVPILVILKVAIVQARDHLIRTRNQN